MLATLAPLAQLVPLLSILALMIGLLSALKLYKNKCNPHPEVTRKILHVVMGLVSLSFPHLFSESWPVVVLAVVSSALLLTIKHWGPARQTLGSVYCQIERKTWGEPCFALGIAFLFCLRGSDDLLYYIPVLILTFADTLSALVGISCGRRAYTTREGQKTSEGSLAFFLSASFFTWALLTLSQSVDPTRAVCIALILSGLVTLFEAIAWRGLDNLFVPVSAFTLLKIYLVMDIPSLLLRLLVASLLVAAALVYRKRTTLDDSAVLGAALTGYVGWALGGWQWLVPPLVVLIFYRKFLPAQYQHMDRLHSIGTVLSVSAVGFCWLVLAKLTNSDQYFLPYVLTYAAHLAVIAVAHLGPATPQTSDVELALLSSLRAWFLLFAPYVIMEHSSQASYMQALLALPIIAAAVAVFLAIKYRTGSMAKSKTRWVLQVAAAAVASLSAAPLPALLELASSTAGIFS